MSEIRSVSVRLSARTSEYIAGMGAATRSTETLGASLSRVEARGAAASRGLSGLKHAAVYGTAGVVAGFVVAEKAAADFGEKMALVQTLSHANAQQMRALSNEALNAGQRIGYTAGQVADGEAEMIKAGVSLRDILKGGLKGALDLAAAGQTDVATATTIAASAMTQFKLQGKDIPHLADLLAAGADKALGSVEDLGYGLSQAGTTAHQMGLDVNQTVGTLAAFAQAGLIGERGGTTFKQMLLQLASPTKNAQAYMDAYGLSLYKANGQIKTMPELADNLRRSFEHLTPAQRNAALGTIFGSRAIQGANILMAEGGKGIADWIRKVNDQGFAAQQASGKLNSLKGDLAKFKSEVQSDLINLGSGSQSPLRGLVQGATRELHKLRADGSLQRWGNEISHTFTTIGQDALPIAHQLGSVLGTVAHGVEGVAHAFDKLPSGLQKTLMTGAVVAYGTRKLGVDSLLKGALGGRHSGGVVGALTGRAGVVPVLVTNPGFGGLGKGIGGGLPGTVAGDAAKAAGKGRAATLLERLGLGAGGLAGADAALLGPVAIGAAATAAAVILAKKAGSNSPDALPAPPNSRGGNAYSRNPVLGANLGGGYSPGPEYAKFQRFINLIEGFHPDTRGNASKAAATEDLSLAKTALGPGGGVNLASQLGVLKSATGLNFKQLMSELPTLDAMLKHAGDGVAELGLRVLKLPHKVQTKIETPGAVKSVADIEALIRRYHLTPSQIRTLIALEGQKGALNDVIELGRRYGLTPKQVRTIIGQVGMDSSQASIRRLAALYHLTPKEVRTLVGLVGAPTALDEIARIKAELASVPRHLQTDYYVNQVNSVSKAPVTMSPGHGKYATGGYTGDRPAHEPVGVVHGREFVFDATATAKAGVGNLYALQRKLRGYADGGYVGGRPGWAGAGWGSAYAPPPWWQKFVHILGTAGGPGRHHGHPQDRLDASIKRLDHEIARNTAELKHKPTKAERARIEANQKELRKQLAHLTAQRQAVRAFSLAGVLPQHTPYNPTLAGTRAQVKAFEHDFVKAGGTWTKSITKHAAKLEKGALAIDRSNRAITKETNERDALKQKLADTISQRNDLASNVSGMFTGTDLFASQALPSGAQWLSAADRKQFAADPLSKLRGDIANEQQFTALAGTLSKSLHGNALAYVEQQGVGALQTLSQMSPADLKSFQTLFDQRANGAVAAGKLAGDQRYGAAVAAQTRELATANQHLAAMNRGQAALIKRVEHMEATLKLASEENARIVGQEIRGEVKAGTTKAKAGRR